MVNTLKKFPPLLEFFTKRRLGYRDDNIVFRDVDRELIYSGWDENFSEEGELDSSIYDIDHRSLLRSGLKVRELFFNKMKRDYEIISYSAITKRGWCIIQRPLLSTSSSNYDQKFIYYLRHSDDKIEIVGKPLFAQPPGLLIQIDNVNKCIRLVGKHISGYGGNYSPWRKYIR